MKSMSRAITLCIMQGFILTAITAAVRCRSSAPGHGVWLKSVSRTITMQGFILTAITAAE